MRRSSIRARWGNFILLFLLTAIFCLGSLALPARAYTAAQYQRMAREIATDMAGLIGRRLTKPIYVSLSAEDATRFSMTADDGGITIPVVRQSGRWEDAQADASATEWAACLIVLSDLTGSDDTSIRSTVAHEVYHCFQYELLSINHHRPDWLIEGTAEWAGEAYVGGSTSSAESWEGYFSRRDSLYERDYDAIGLYAHLHNLGANVWREMDDLLLNPDSSAALAASAGAVGEARFSQTWPMGLARRPDWGADWDTTGPGITGHQRRPTSVGSLPVEIIYGAASPSLSTVPVPSGEIIEIQAEGYGALRWGDSDGQTVYLNPGFNQRYCVGESCRCEDGSLPPGVQEVESGALTVAAVGGFSPGDGRRVSIRTSDPDCDEPEDPFGSGDTGGAGAWGGGGDRARGTSYGDPHIITYDGYRYSFQTVGEFLLTRSVDGRFEVQARQQQVPGRQLSMNTAVALGVNGHRVAIYAQNAPDGRSPLWIDGVPMALGNSSLPLPGGGTVQRRDNHYTVTWPGGEVVRIAGVEMGGALFFSITPDVPRRPGQYLGLLGDLNRNPDDDLRIRDGGVVPTKDAYAPVTQLVSGLIPSPIPLSTVENAFFQQLYRQFGDSWRISQGESLFDYGPGQSTETFTDRAFPSQFPTLMGVAPAQIQEATRLCEAAEVDDWFMEGCVFDVAATGQPSFAQGAVSAIADALITEIQDRIVDEIEDEVRQNIPIPLPIPRFPF